MHPDVVITTHGDLVAHAPQTLYLAKALSGRGIRVELVSNAPAAMREQLRSSNPELNGPSDSSKEARLRLVTI